MDAFIGVVTERDIWDGLLHIDCMIGLNDRRAYVYDRCHAHLGLVADWSYLWLRSF
jgi:hypothetical protein